MADASKSAEGDASVPTDAAEQDRLTLAQQESISKAITASQVSAHGITHAAMSMGMEPATKDTLS